MRQALGAGRVARRGRRPARPASERHVSVCAVALGLGVAVQVSPEARTRGTSPIRETTDLGAKLTRDVQLGTHGLHRVLETGKDKVSCHRER